MRNLTESCARSMWCTLVYYVYVFIHINASGNPGPSETKSEISFANRLWIVGAKQTQVHACYNDLVLSSEARFSQVLPVGVLRKDSFPASSIYSFLVNGHFSWFRFKYEPWFSLINAPAASDCLSSWCSCAGLWLRSPSSPWLCITSDAIAWQACDILTGLYAAFQLEVALLLALNWSLSPSLSIDSSLPLPHQRTSLRFGLGEWISKVVTGWWTPGSFYFSHTRVDVIDRHCFQSAVSREH